MIRSCYHPAVGLGAPHTPQTRLPQPIFAPQARQKTGAARRLLKYPLEACSGKDRAEKNE
jgi:hypothetical protein